MKRILLIIAVGQGIGWLSMLLMFIYDHIMNTNLVSNGLQIGSICIDLALVFIYFIKRDGILGKIVKKRIIAVLCVIWLAISVGIGLAIVIIANPEGITREVRPRLIEFTTFGFGLGIFPVISVVIGEPIIKAIKRG